MLSNKLYTLNWTTVESHVRIGKIEDESKITGVKLFHKTQKIIVEAVNELVVHPDRHGHTLEPYDMPNYGFVLRSWIDTCKPVIHSNYHDCKIVIIHSIEPYEPSEQYNILRKDINGQCTRLYTRSKM
jgi:hypothetical protein